MFHAWVSRSPAWCGNGALPQCGGASRAVALRRAGSRAPPPQPPHPPAGDALEAAAARVLSGAEQRVPLRLPGAPGAAPPADGNGAPGLGRVPSARPRHCGGRWVRRFGRRRAPAEPAAPWGGLRCGLVRAIRWTMAMSMRQTPGQAGSAWGRCRPAARAGPAPGEAPGLPAKRARVDEAARRAVTLETAVPEYSAPPPAGGRGAQAPRARLFRRARRFCVALPEPGSSRCCKGAAQTASSV